MERCTIRAACVLACTVLSSCATLPPPPQVDVDQRHLSALHSLPVVPFFKPSAPLRVSGGGSGSAIVISPRHLLYTLHQVPQDRERITFTADFETGYRTLASGRADRHPDQPLLEPVREDWVLVELDEPFPGPPNGPVAAQDINPPVVDFHRPIESGQVVYLVGYPFAPSIRPLGDVDELLWPPERFIIGGIAVEQPNGFGDIEGLLYIHTPSFDSGGMSGGAAVIWDDELNAPIIVGIITASFSLRQGRKETLYLGAVRPDLTLDTAALRARAE